MRCVKKQKTADDQLPHCSDCKLAEFKADEEIGECHLLPMDWVPVEGEGPVAMWKPAHKDGYCRYFERKVH